jgi:hypothetical protein
MKTNRELNFDKWGKDVKYVNNQMQIKKSKGLYLNLYGILYMVYKDSEVTVECFNYFFDKLDKENYTQAQLEEIKGSFPEHLIPKKEVKEPPRDLVMVKNYLSVSKNPGSVAELKKFAKEQGLDYNVFRQWVRKHKPDLVLESLRPSRIVTEKEMQAALQLLKSGLTIIKVKESTGIPVAILNKLADENGIHRIRRNRVKAVEKISEPDINEGTIEVTKPVEVPEVKKPSVMNPVQGFFAKRNSEPELLTGDEAINKLEEFFDGREFSRQIFTDLTGYAKRISSELRVSLTQATKYLKHKYHTLIFEGAIKNASHLINEANLWMAQRIFQTEKLNDFKFDEIKHIKEMRELIKEIKSDLESDEYI